MTSEPSRPLRAVTVFCGSSSGFEPAYEAAAVAMGELLVERGIGLVYGGGSVGLMGVVADTVLAGGGHVTGVIPRHLWEKEVGHGGLSELLIVESMHERKQVMADRGDAFIALPGGVGTFEELFEAMTWTQLGLHAKPVGLLDVAGFYAPLLAFLDGTVDAGFLKPEHREILHATAEPTDLLDALATWQPPTTAKWFVREAGALVGDDLR
jgi:hypothetical protein